MQTVSFRRATGNDVLTLFLCGDVMLGRGIDQVLPHSNPAELFEPYVRTAKTYVELAEAKHGPIPRPVGYSYIWGEALKELERVAPDVRIINLETSVTMSEDYWSDKPVHYRMHPENVQCLTAAAIDCCVLANNHVMDWGGAGLEQTLDTLGQVGMQVAGAGRTLEEAQRPAVLQAQSRSRVLVFALGVESSGIPPEWAATTGRPGVNFQRDLSRPVVQMIAESIQAVKRQGDIVVASIHWGGNWGYGIPREQVEFAHALIDEAAVDVIHGHSSHHPKGIEVYGGRPILYGCGEFVDDYEGISGHERFRPDLVLMYFPTIRRSDNRLVQLEMVPLQLRRFRLNRASTGDTQWLKESLSRNGEAFGTCVELGPDGTLMLRWG